MIGMRATALLCGILAPLSLALLAGACGARSDLLLRDQVALDDAGLPAPPDDAGGVDAPPGDDVIPGIDVQVRDVVTPPACADASDTLVYVVTQQNTLLKFKPSSATFSVIGSLVCPDPFGRNPFSMAVDRLGNAYVLYYDDPGAGPPTTPGNIFKVNLNNAACEGTSYVAGQQGFFEFGMGFAANDTGDGETLYVASDDTSPGRLGAITETGLALSVVGALPPTVVQPELTGTGDGRLFAFYLAADGTSMIIGQLDKTTAALVGQAGLPQVTRGNAWAFAFWGGAFYTFTSPDDTTSIVQRYDPTTGAVVEVATYPELIVGAGVSTCAPIQ